MIARGRRCERATAAQEWRRLAVADLAPPAQRRRRRHQRGRCRDRRRIDDAIGMPGAVTRLPVTPQRLR
jgi:hypothetical protein